MEKQFEFSIDSNLSCLNAFPLSVNSVVNVFCIVLLSSAAYLCSALSWGRPNRSRRASTPSCSALRRWKNTKKASKIGGIGGKKTEQNL